jgi:hypothetical protein
MILMGFAPGTWYQSAKQPQVAGNARMNASSRII